MMRTLDLSAVYVDFVTNSIPLFCTAEVAALLDSAFMWLGMGPFVAPTVKGSANAADAKESVIRDLREQGPTFEWGTSGT